MSLSFDRGYADRRVNYTKKHFRKLAPVANFIKLFRCNLCRYRRMSLSFDRGYTARCVNYTKNSFRKSAPVANFIKLCSVYFMPLLGYVLKF